MPNQHQQASARNEDSSHTKSGGIHRDWRFWLAVVLMLGAMVAYVATNDEQVVPGGPAQQEVPADAE